MGLILRKGNHRGRGKRYKIQRRKLFLLGKICLSFLETLRMLVWTWTRDITLVWGSTSLVRILNKSILDEF